ncbi:MAG: CaiB/BaiF CoA transferase family protein [Acidimicrobiales bacterium]
MTDRPPLDGVLVADFSRVLAGPLATMTLADLGASVIKVEAPGVGDDTRTWGPPFAGGDSTYFLSVNRNKRSVVLDLREAGDQRRAVALARRSDVLVENFRPGTMESFGLGHSHVQAVNPGVIYATVTGFGSDGPGREWAGYDFLVQAMSGLMSITGQQGDTPTKVGVAVVDVLCGLQLTIAILAALQARHRDGVGQRVEASLFDAAFAGLVNQASAYLNADAVPTALGNRHPSIAPYELVSAADASFAIAVGSDRLWELFCREIGLPELSGDTRFATNEARVDNRRALLVAIEPSLAKSTAVEWIARLRAVGIPAGPVNDVAHAAKLARTLGRAAVELRRPDGSTARSPRSPLRLDHTPVTYRHPPPALDEHGPDIRAWLDE